jgi:hypothetical protein
MKAFLKNLLSWISSIEAIIAIAYLENKLIYEGVA